MNVERHEADAPVTIASYLHAHEAELARALLDSQGISAVVQHDHGQYVSIAPWVQLQVAQHDREVATTVLEQGPLEPGETEAGSESDSADDLRPVRLKRRFVLARWFLYASALALLLTGWVTGPLFLVPLGLGLWSRSNPRRAFGVAFFLQALYMFVSIALQGPIGLGAVIPLTAYYWAWAGAKPEPPDQLLTSPYPDTPTIAIGQAWKEGGANREPSEHPIWILRDLGVLALVLLLILVIRQAISMG